jgi:hypothetical protein
LIDWIISLFVDWFDKLQNAPFCRIHTATAIVAGCSTIGIWLLHIRDPHLFGYLSAGGAVSRLLFLIVLIPPFLAAFCLGKLVFPSSGASVPGQAGPLSAYLTQEAASRKWRLMIGAAVVGAANLLLLMFTSY